jgi:hypothetical protein
MVTAHNVSPTPKQSAPGLPPPRMGRAALVGMGAAGASLALFYYYMRRNQVKMDTTGGNPSFEHRMAHAASTNGELDVDPKKASSAPRRPEPLSSPSHDHKPSHVTLNKFSADEDNTQEKRREVPPPQRARKDDDELAYSKKVAPKLAANDGENTV